MKKILFISIAILFFGIVPHVLAEGSGFTALAPIPGLTDISPTAIVNSTSLANFFNNLYKYLIGLAAILAVIEIIYAGFRMATNQDNVSVLTDSKGKIWQAILGLVLVLSPVIVFSIINPSILNLSFNLPALDTISGTGGGNGAVTNPATSITDAAPGCSVTGTLFRKANCSSAKAAQDWAASCKSGVGNVIACSTSDSSGKPTCSTFQATCDTKAGPYIFIDVSQGGFSFQGILNGIIQYKSLQPIASTPDNPNNGNQIMQFAASCAADGASFCMSRAINAVVNPEYCKYKSQSSQQSSTCYIEDISCTNPSTLTSIGLTSWSCYSNVKFTIIQ
ncbi:MAG: hypothetical protein V1711_00520 [bacterium]